MCPAPALCGELPGNPQGNPRNPPVTGPSRLCLSRLEDSEASKHVDERLSAAAPLYPGVRFLRCAADDGPPASLAFVRRLPALLHLREGRVVSAATDLAEAREPAPRVAGAPKPPPPRPCVASPSHATPLQSQAVQGHAVQGYATQGHAAQDYAAQDHAAQDHAAQGNASQG